MGCEVVSIYADQVIGKLGYSKSIMDDLIQRDYHPKQNYLQYRNLSSAIQKIHGFTQSYVKSCFYTALINNRQFFIYNSGRFVIKQSISLPRTQQFISHQQIINNLDVKDKMCLVGLQGGKLLLWDLQYMTSKIQIILPQVSVSISTVALTQKYLFVIDSSQPNNIAYCYDMRTTKLKAFVKIPSLQPTIRAVGVNGHHLISAAADGLWFMRYSLTDNQIQIVKGMFGKYPKTSMTCLCQVRQNYLASGGVDGYAYLWSITTSSCIKVVKWGDDQITSMKFITPQLIIAGNNCRTKVVTVEFNKKISEEEIEDQDKFNIIVVDAYQKQSSTQFIAQDLVTPLLYYCQTRKGLLFQRYLPSSQISIKKINRVTDSDNLKKYNFSGLTIQSSENIFNIYRINHKSFNIDSLIIQVKQIKLNDEYLVSCQSGITQFFDYSQKTEELIHSDKANKIYAQKPIPKTAVIISEASKSQQQQTSKCIFDIQNEELQNIALLLDGSLLIITTNQSIILFKRVARLEYEELKQIKYDKVIPENIKYEDYTFSFNQHKWEISNALDLNKQLADKILIHCGKSRCRLSNQKFSVVEIH